MTFLSLWGDNYSLLGVTILSPSPSRVARWLHLRMPTRAGFRLRNALRCDNEKASLFTREAMDEMIPETHAHGAERGATYSLLIGFCLMLAFDVLLG